MRFVLAIVSLVIAIGLAGYGVAQRTVLSEPDSLTVTSDATSDATVTVIGGDTLNALDGRQQLRISGSDTIFAAFARTNDVLAWVGDATYNSVEFDPESRELQTVTQDGAEEVVPNPAGSDLWLREYTAEDLLNFPVNLSEDLSIIVVSDGVEPAPSTVAITWPLDNRTPWAGPLIAAGGAMFVIALAFLLWGLVHRRRTRGPRRKSIKAAKTPKMPKLPRQRSYRVRKPKAIEIARGRRSTRRMTALVPTVLIATVVLSGCSSDLWPELGGAAASPSPSASAPAEEVQPPAATVGQVESIVRDVSAVAEASDAALDGEALKTRFEGPALALRTGNYAIRAKDSAFPALAPIPSDVLRVTLPEKLQPEDDAWPRTIFTVVEQADEAAASDAPATSDAPTDEAVAGEAAAKPAPIALTLVQSGPREPYKVNYSVALEPNAVLPELAPETVGASRLPPDTKLLSMPPGELAAAYVDVLTLGAESEFYDLFDIEKDGFIPTVGVEARAARKAALPATATIEFTIAPTDAEIIALLSNESGALVTLAIADSETVKPATAGDTLNPEGATKTLSGITGTTKGVTAGYSDQLLFYIPPVGSSDKIVLLGFSQGLTSAQEIP